ncbi:MAG: hypothetical protein U9Q81_18465 [Pseudomonadota bacterium]|nr:hypothetical protein [Pseudomonadota bacterium]
MFKDDDRRAAIDRFEADPIGFFLRRANAGNKPAGNDLIERFILAADKGAEIDGRLLAFITEKLRRILAAEDPRKVFPKPNREGRPSKDNEHSALATAVASRMLGDPIKPDGLDEFDPDNWTRADNELEAIATVAADRDVSESIVKKAFQDWRPSAYWQAAYLKKRRRL